MASDEQTIRDIQEKKRPEPDPPKAARAILEEYIDRAREAQRENMLTAEGREMYALMKADWEERDRQEQEQRRYWPFAFRRIPREIASQFLEREDEKGTRITKRKRWSDLIKAMKVPQTIALIGPCGTGKTLTACYWLWRGCNERDAEYLMAADYLALNEAWGPDREELRRIQRMPCVVLDEAGKGYKPSDWARLRGFLMERHNAMLRTVIIANMESSEAFLEVIGTALARRILKRGKVWEMTDVLCPGAKEFKRLSPCE
jgi:DNA replication protein DnaC